MRWALTLPLTLAPGLKRRPSPPRCPANPPRRCRLPPRPALLRPTRPRGGCPVRHLPRRLLLGHSGQPGVPALPGRHVPQVRLAANRVLHVPARLLERPRRRRLPPLRARHRGARRGDRARPRHRHLPRLVGGAPAVGQRADGTGGGRAGALAMRIFQPAPMPLRLPAPPPRSPPGKYVMAWGSHECDPCPPNTHAPEPRAAVCAQCSAGEVARASGAVRCAACPPGSYAGAGDLVCSR